MEKLLEKELIKECGMLIEEAINEVEPNEKLASLYADSLKGFMSHNYEAGEKSLDLYLKELIKIKINELAEESLRGNYNDEKSINLCLKKISKISGKKAEEYAKEIKEDIINNIKQNEKEIDNQMYELILLKHFRALLRENDCSKESYEKVNKDIVEITDKELNEYRKMTNNVSDKIKSSIANMDERSIPTSLGLKILKMELNIKLKIKSIFDSTKKILSNLFKKIGRVLCAVGKVILKNPHILDDMLYLVYICREAKIEHAYRRERKANKAIETKAEKIENAKEITCIFNSNFINRKINGPTPSIAK